MEEGDHFWEEGDHFLHGVFPYLRNPFISTHESVHMSWLLVVFDSQHRTMTVPGGTRTTGPGWKCDPPCLGGPLRSIVAGSGCGPPVSLLSCPRFLKAANLCRFLLATIRLDLCFLGFARGARGALLGRGPGVNTPQAARSIT